MANVMRVRAKPVNLIFKDDCYALMVQITHGPVNMVGKRVCVELTSRQLDQISGWEPQETGDSTVIEGK